METYDVRILPDDEERIRRMAQGVARLIDIHRCASIAAVLEGEYRRVYRMGRAAETEA